MNNPFRFLFGRSFASGGYVSAPPEGVPAVLSPGHAELRLRREPDQATLDRVKAMAGAGATITIAVKSGDEG